MIVSHSMEQILQFSDRAVWLESGRIVATGDPLEIVNRYEEFIHLMDREQRGKAAGRSGNTNTLFDIPEWFREKTRDAEGGADWGGDGPLRITRIGSLDEEGKEAEVVTTGRPFGFFAEIVSEEKGEFSCSCLFVMYNEQGDVVTRVVEPERIYTFDHDVHRIEVKVDDNPIGGGLYILSGGLYREYRLGMAGQAHRYHVLSRGCRLRIQADSRDNSRVRLRARWSSSGPARENFPRRTGGGGARA